MGRVTGSFAALLALLALTAAVPPEPSGPGAPPQQVIGGEPVPDGAYPFQAALLNLRYGSTDPARQFCGGTLITADHVLTAAHCVDDVGLLTLRNLRVVVGRADLTSTAGRRVPVASLLLHPQYDAQTRRNDVAVVRLRQPVTEIAPIRVVGEGDGSLEQPGARATVTGWGNIVAQPPSGGGPFVRPDRMQAATVPLVPDSTCETAYGSTGDGIRFVAEGMVCAGTAGLDTCQGDSGGPLFAAGADGYTQIGVTSWGAGCGAEGYPGVYTQLSSAAIASFIRNATGLG